jgi:soluble lytic murein transglycosylase-like protein
MFLLSAGVFRENVMKKHHPSTMVLAAVVFSLLESASMAPAAAAEAKAPVQHQVSGAQSALSLYRGVKPARAAKAKNVPKPSSKKQSKSGRRRTRRNTPSVAGEEVAKYKALVSCFAKEYGVPPALAHAVVTVESNYYPKARGKDGEIGLMQIMPATARGMGFRGSFNDLYHPKTNIKWGMQYLAKAYKLGGKTTCGAILKYNAGHGAKRMNPISSAYCAKVKRILGE